MRLRKWTDAAGINGHRQKGNITSYPTLSHLHSYSMTLQTCRVNSKILSKSYLEQRLTPFVHRGVLKAHLLSQPQVCKVWTSVVVGKELKKERWPEIKFKNGSLYSTRRVTTHSVFWFLYYTINKTVCCSLKGDYSARLETLLRLNISFLPVCLLHLVNLQWEIFYLSNENITRLKWLTAGVCLSSLFTPLYEGCLI